MSYWIIGMPPTGEHHLSDDRQAWPTGGRWLQRCLSRPESNAGSVYEACHQVRSLLELLDKPLTLAEIVHAHAVALSPVVERLETAEFQFVGGAIEVYLGFEVDAAGSRNWYMMTIELRFQSPSGRQSKLTGRTVLEPRLLTPTARLDMLQVPHAVYFLEPRART